MPEHGQRVADHLRRLRSRDREAESLESAARAPLAAAVESAGVPQEQFDRIESADAKIRRGESLDAEEAFALEAIILPGERPVVDVVQDRFHPPEAPRWRFLGEDDAIRARIEAALPAVGRVELTETSRPGFLGTGFMVGPDLLLTNRHIADDFVMGLGTRLRFSPGLHSVVDLERWVVASDGFELRVARPLIVHPWWDAALLQVEGFPEDRAPLSLIGEQPSDLDGRVVVCIGYPAFDDRNDIAVQNRVFRGLFNVKRLQPGIAGDVRTVESFGKDVEALSHDCSTLGGNSGSAVIDVETGHALALHFGGLYLESNYAVPAWELAADPEVRGLSGVRIEGSPAAAGAWVSVWDSLRPRPPGGESRETGDATPGLRATTDWFERSGDEDIARAYRADPESTHGRLVEVLGVEEADDLIRDLEDEMSASEGTTEGWFSRTPDPDLPEIVFLHGIMGSHLANQGFFTNRLWLDPVELVKGNLAERLSLGPDGLTDHEGLRIEPDGHIQLKYRKAKRKWRKQRFAVHPFSFDWRKGIDHAARQLHAFLQQRNVTTNGKRVVLIGHSMGGLVISLYSSRFPQWTDRVERAIFMGSPLGGSYAVPIAVFGYNDMLRKLAFLSRRDDLVQFRQMTARLPGLIDMLPHPGLFPDAERLFHQGGWGDAIVPRQRWLTQSRNLKRILREAPVLERTTLLVSLGHGTVSSWDWVKGEPGPPTGIGDGTVPAASALVDGLPAFQVDRTHDDIPNDPQAIQAAVELITTGATPLPPVIDSDLSGTREAPVSWEEASTGELESRRGRFEAGELTREDLAWLGSF